MKARIVGEKIALIVFLSCFACSCSSSMGSAAGSTSGQTSSANPAGTDAASKAAPNSASTATTANLAVEPSSILAGQSATLSWTSQGATSLDLEPGVGSVAAQGSIAVSPSQTTTYTLTAKGNNGNTKARAVVTVSTPSVAPVPTVTLSASAGTISAGETLTLTWSSQNATSLDLEPGIGGVALQGSVTVAPAQTTSYTLTATGSGGTATASTMITVAAGIVLSSADSIEDAVNANPASTTFVLTPGIYRMQSVIPKDGDIFSGESGAILDGAELLTDWRQQSSSVWVAQAQNITQASSYRGVCQANYPECAYPEDLFFDSQPLRRVASLAQVTPGAWYFDYGTEKAYVGSDPSGHVTELSALRAAFSGSAKNVTIQGLAIQKYASIAGAGAINASSISGEVNNWIVQGDDISLNHGMGLRINNGMQVTNCKFHDNGQLGLGGSAAGVLVQGSEIYRNNYAGYSWGWEAGGVKFTRASQITLSGNYAHDNYGPGLWADISCQYLTFDGNHTAHNLEAGIIYEISYYGTIKNNLTENEGSSPNGNTIWYGDGILISNSSNVEVYGNTATACVNGIGAIQAARGADPGTGQPYDVKNLSVHDNTISQPQNFAAGIVKASTFDNSVYTSWGNHFHNNTFNLLDTSKPAFVWLGQPWTLEQWNLYSSEH